MIDESVSIATLGELTDNISLHHSKQTPIKATKVSELRTLPDVCARTHTYHIGLKGVAVVDKCTRQRQSK